MEITPDCDEPITLTKMEIVDTQSDVHLEDSDSQHLEEAHYISLHRVSDLAKNLTEDEISEELLSHHVVDSDYGQHVVTSAQFYDNSEFLSSSFTEEERRIDLVAVQFMHDDRSGSTTNEGNLSNDLLDVKTTLPAVSSLSSDKNVLSAIVSNYVQSVDHGGNRNRSEIIHIPASVHDQHSIIKVSPQQNDQLLKIYPSSMFQQDKLPTLPSLKKINTVPIQKFGSPENTNVTDVLVNSNLVIEETSPQQIHKTIDENFKCQDVEAAMNGSAIETDNDEEYKSEPQGEIHSSQKSLPHKKRIPSKLKKALTVGQSCDTLIKSYKCMKCDQQFPNQSLFNAHVCNDSSKKILFVCELCNKSCTNQLKFFEHLKSHYEPFINVNHLNNESEPSSSVTEKEKCERTVVINLVSSPSEHQPVDDELENEYSNDGTSNFTCDKCGLVFRRQKAYDCHMSISHPNQEEIEEFSEPEDMMEGIRHVVNMVPTLDEEDKSYDSWDASKSPESSGNQSVTSLNPVSKSELKSEQDAGVEEKLIPEPESVTTIEKMEPEVDPDDTKQENQTNNSSTTKGRKQMPCPHCPRTFVHRNSLLYHIRSHTGHRPHQCHLCGKSFFAAGALKIHHRLHSGDKPYKCEYCGRFFRQWGDLKYHFTSLHSNTKMFQCEYCGKDFARKYSLVVHRRIHTGEKNYICEFCTKTFRAASYLQNHRRIHTGEKPHACSVCGKLFRVRSDMKRHMKTHPDAIVETSSNNRGNNVTDERNAVNNQELVLAPEDNKPNIEELEAEQNIKPVISEAGTPLNLNVRPVTGEENLYNYQREDLVDRENAGTVFLWIQTNPDSMLQNN